MTKPKILGLILTVGLLLPVAIAQGGGQARQHPGPGKNQQQRPIGKAGDWIRNHQGMTPEQQQRALENDPGFKDLPAARQAALRERLRKFNSLDPQQRERAMRRWEFLETLKPEQREQLRQSNQELKKPSRRPSAHGPQSPSLPAPDDPEGREEVFKSDRFHNTFSGQEQDILKRLSAFSPPPEEPASDPGR